jgi:hypothetical protein
MSKIKYLYSGLLLAALSVTGCTKDFSDLNVSKSSISEANVNQLFTQVEDRMTIRYYSWFVDQHSNFAYWTQLNVPSGGNSSKYNRINGMDGGKREWYLSILALTNEMRNTINAKSDEEKAKYKLIEATSYLPEIQYGMSVVALYGSLPFSEAVQGRNGNFSPKYDTQEQIFRKWAETLDNVEATYKQYIGQASQYKLTGDIYYSGDMNKWAKLVNVLRLKLAQFFVARGGADLDFGKQLINKANTDSYGIFGGATDQMVYTQPTYRGDDPDVFGNMASKALMTYMKKTSDPRLPIFWEKNDYAKDANYDAAKAAGKLPATINKDTDPYYYYQGIPACPDSVAADAARTTPWYYNNVNVKVAGEDKTLVAGSIMARRLFQANNNSYAPAQAKGDGDYVEPILTYSEVCFLMAEYVIKGYVDSPKKTYAEYYSEGVKSSMNLYAYMAVKHKVGDYNGGETMNAADVAAYLAKPEVALTGNKANDFEKIFIQQYVDFFRTPVKAYLLCLRTGYPRIASTLLAFEKPVSGGADMVIPRRYVLADPGDFNRTNWDAALKAQGFIPVGATDPEKLNGQRTWWDAQNPDFGKGALLQ